MSVIRPTPAFAVSHPAHLVATGFGVGLAPRAPGTFGTLAGWAAGWLLLPPLGAPLALALAAALFAIGVWACAVTGRHLGAHDHGSMVWDEIVAFLLVLAILPPALEWQIAGFLLFRLFDVAKPPPIRWFEARYRGGFGVMFDDLLAAGYTLVVLAVFKRFFL